MKLQQRKSEKYKMNNIIKGGILNLFQTIEPKPTSHNNSNTT
jgi:hypothetical protein